MGGIREKMTEKIEKPCASEAMNHDVVDNEEEYYIKAFKRLDERGKHTWNWAACIFGSAWMAYRKMYLYAFLFFIICGVFNYCTFSLIAFNVYGNFLPFNLLENEHPRLYLFAEVCCWIIGRIFTGYFGNALYYSAVKKKIQKGYHLLQKYRPTSIPSALIVIYSPFICFADWISRKSQLKTEVKSEINEETVRACLNPNKENHIAVKIAGIFAYLILIASFIAGFMKGFNESYEKAKTQVTLEKRI